MQELIRYADRLVGMTRKAEQILGEVHSVRPECLTMIPHGIPEKPAEIPPAAHEAEFDAAGWTVLRTFGLLSPGKRDWLTVAHRSGAQD